MLLQTLRELGKEALDRLQIPQDDISYPSKVPFAMGTFSEVCTPIPSLNKAYTELVRVALGLRASLPDFDHYPGSTLDSKRAHWGS